MKSKYIHYCWFGDKPLPKLALKCIESWKKYLPDYEIIRWNEENVDINECPFIKEAYENKKWAFVADYARTKAIYEMGGIYFDTDMLITKPIDFLLENETFLGIEDSFSVNSAVWGTTKPKTYFAKRLLDFYQKEEHFDINNLFRISIPRNMTRILNELGFDHTSNEIQKLPHNITIYPREYFYPLSFDFTDNVFTDNTCMIHYFDASWFSPKEKLRIKLNRKFGKENIEKVIIFYKRVRHFIGRVVRKFLYKPAKYFKYTYLNDGKYLKQINETISKINNYDGKLIVFYNPEWLGVTNATLELFGKYSLPCGEIFRKKDVKKVSKTILDNGIEQIVFSAMCIGWKEIAEYVKKKNSSIKFKVFWHGSLSQVLEPYGWNRHLELIDMCKNGIIDVFGTCKKSMIDFYKENGIKTHFLMNNVKLQQKINHKEPENITIGLYASQKDNWIKNLFTQIAAVSLIKNVTIDLIPMDNEAAQFARNLGLKVTGINKPIPRNELIERMAKNTLNLYVTFSECAPMLPLESFETDTICLVGNNNHYFKNTELEEYLVISNEEDPVEISKKIKKSIKEKDKIINLYKEWKKSNDKLCEKSVKEFIEM